MNPPPNQEDFDKLSIREELSYAKPILTAVLNDEYKPACRHHADFIRGGKSREAVVAGAAARGTVSPKHVAALQGYIIRWVIEGGATASQEVGPSELDNDKSEVWRSWLSNLRSFVLIYFPDRQGHGSLVRLLLRCHCP